MNARDQATAAALLLRWFEAYTNGTIAVPTGATGSTAAYREISGLAAATKAFVSNQGRPICAPGLCMQPSGHVGGHDPLPGRRRLNEL